MRLKGNKVLSLLGLAKKAGKVASGEFSTEAAVKSQKACMVIVSEEASWNTRKKFQDMCAWYHVPIFLYGGKEELGRCIGQELRASIAVTDPGFSEAIQRELGNVDERRA